MSLVSKVGRGSLGVRLLFLAMYILLSVGGVTMVYPFLMMATMSTTSSADSQDFRLMPRYWVSDADLFKKYLVDAAPFADLSTWFHKDTWFVGRDIKGQDLAATMRIPAARRRAMAADMTEFIEKVCPAEFKAPLFHTDRDSPLALRNQYSHWLESRYGSLDEVNRRYMDDMIAWDDLTLVYEPQNRRPDSSLRTQDWRKFIESRPAWRTGLADPDPLVYQFLSAIKIPDSYVKKNPSRRLVISKINYDELSAGKLGNDLLERFITQAAPTRFIQIDTAQASAAWRKFLKSKGENVDTPLMNRVPLHDRQAGLWGQFIQNGCPLRAMKLLRPEDYWRSFVAKRYGAIAALNKAYGAHYGSFGEVEIPYAAFHYDNFLRHKNALLLDYLTHNILTVLSFITLHGNAAFVTLIYIALTIATTLTVNPMAAYAMSRFRLRHTYHILVFLLATMAFPTEVLMIPGFLMLKSFPLLQIAIVGLCALAFALIQMKLKNRVPLAAGGTAALIITVFLAGWAAPHLAGAFNINLSLSLLNTFWALVLPGLANGYGIFLLKGFFDSLPPTVQKPD